MTEPMSDARLSAIRGRFAWQRIDWSMEVTNAFRELIAEVERLKAREADLAADIQLLGGLGIEMVNVIQNCGLRATASGFARQLEERP